MNVVTWVLQILLALAFLAAGVTKLTQPKEKLRARMAWTDDFSANAVKGIGAAEVLGAIGLVGPWALNVAPVLTPLAATGLVLTMIGAVITHRRRKETKEMAPALVLGVLSAVVAIARF